MSHFAVAVITDKPEVTYETIRAMLLPYMENCCEEPPKQYMEFCEDEDCDIDPDTGKRGYWQNPNAKWDWFQVGGRFSYMLRATDGEYGELSWGRFGEKRPEGRFDSAKIKDIDFTPDQEASERAIAQWEYNVEGKEGDADLRWWCSTDYMVNRYGDKETYAKVESTVFWRAVITPDGKWHEVGEMGWFACSSESGEEYVDWALNFKERFIDPCDPECFLTVVDCHI